MPRLASPPVPRPAPGPAGSFPADTPDLSRGDRRRRDAASPPAARTGPTWWTLAVALLLACAACAWDRPDIEAARLIVRVTARTSLALYLLALCSASLALRWPSRLTGWLAARRQAWGLGLAFSHAVHAAAVLTFARLDPVAFAAASGNPIPGAVAYGFLIAMTVSSLRAVRQRLGERRWRHLQHAGLLVLGLSFAVANGKRVPTHPAYAVPLVLLVAGAAVRWRPQRRAAAERALTPPGTARSPSA